MSKEYRIYLGSIYGRNGAVEEFEYSSIQGVLVRSNGMLDDQSAELKPTTEEFFLSAGGDEKWLNSAKIEVAEMLRSDETAKAAITAIEQEDPEYWEKTLLSRLQNGVGSRTNFKTIQELRAALRKTTFVPYKHEAIAEDCIAFECNIGGFLGIVPIESQRRYQLQDPKGTGKVTPVLAAEPGVTFKRPVEFSVLICGEEKGKLVAFTFHPGEPVRPSEVAASEGMVGKVITGKEALELGLTYAKVS